VKEKEEEAEGLRRDIKIMEKRVIEIKRQTLRRMEKDRKDFEEKVRRLKMKRMEDDSSMGESERMNPRDKSFVF